MKSKVLLVLNHAPDFRESFLRELGNLVDLTVIASSCEEGNLIPPNERQGYHYKEVQMTRYLGLQWPQTTFTFDELLFFDVICCSFSLRAPYWWLLFMKYPSLRIKWVWWGQIYGRSNSLVFNGLRKLLLTRSASVLVYTNEIAKRLKHEFGLEAVSFNNTEICESEFQTGVHEVNSRGRLNLLFVGRNQERKKLHRLIDLIGHNRNMQLRLVGKGMSDLPIPGYLFENERIKTYGHTAGYALKQHFDWADLVVNPGHAGLLVMNAARHGKGILIDKSSHHAPEDILAKEAD